MSKKPILDPFHPEYVFKWPQPDPEIIEANKAVVEKAQKKIKPTADSSDKAVDESPEKE